jgi:hypothetical protein
MKSRNRWHLFLSRAGWLFFVPQWPSSQKSWRRCTGRRRHIAQCQRRLPTIGASLPPFMGIVQHALHRPYTFIVAALLLLIVSLLMILRTPTDIFPNINIPIVSIQRLSSACPFDARADGFGVLPHDALLRGFQNGFECLRERIPTLRPEWCSFAIRETDPKRTLQMTG